HYIWVVRSTLAFEEAAVEHAAKLARRIEAVRQGRWAARPSHAAKSTGRIRLRLAPTGGPGVAILWKNTVGATRDLSQRTFILIAVVVIGGSIALARGPMRGLDLGAGLPATGAVLLVLVLVQNAAVLLFPAWVSVGRDRAVGLEATGQRILMTAGSMVVLVVALVPAIVVGGIAGVAARAGGLPLM